MADEPKDKVTVGVTAAGAANLAKMMQTGWFKEEVDAYRLAISVALARGLVGDPKAMAGLKTKFNVGSLDPDGRIRTMIGLMVADAGSRPYEHAERRAEAGLEFLARRLVDENVMLSDVLLGEDQDQSTVRESR